MTQKAINIIRFIPILNLFMFFIMAFSPSFYNTTKSKYFTALGLVCVGAIIFTIVQSVFSSISDEKVVDLIIYISFYILGIYFSYIASWYFTE